MPDGSRSEAPGERPQCERDSQSFEAAPALHPQGASSPLIIGCGTSLHFCPVLPSLAPKRRAIRTQDAGIIKDMSMPLAFGPTADAEINRILERYPTRQAALIPTLWVTQREFGYLTQ